VLNIDVMVRSADLQVLDPGMPSERRADVQSRMLGADVLDVERFPEITFASTTIVPAAADRWEVTGRLTIHGHVRTITFPVARGEQQISRRSHYQQRDFGIQPIKVAGEPSKVKDRNQTAVRNREVGGLVWLHQTDRGVRTRQSLHASPSWDASAG